MSDLEEIKHYTIRINSLVRVLRNLSKKKYDLRAINYSTERVKSSATGDDKVIIDKCIDLENELKEAISKLNIEKTLAIDKILKVPNIYGDVLLLRYVEQLSWQAIADELDKSVSYLKGIHTQALKMYDEMDS